MKKPIVFLLFFALSVFQFCSEPTSKEPSEEVETSTQTENEDVNQTLERSELAILMRDLYNKTKAYGKEGLPEGKPFPKELYTKYLAILTATPTDSNNTGEVFESYGKGFLSSLEVLTDAENVTYENYNNMVSNCLACHSKHCPGPMLVIRKMATQDPNAS